MLIGASSALAATPAWELISLHGPTNVPLTPSVNQVYTLTIKGNAGQFGLRFKNEETESGEEGETKLLPFHATHEEVQEALEKLKGEKGIEKKAIGAGNVNVTGGPGDEGGTKPYVIEFVGDLADRYLPAELEATEEEPSVKEEEKVENEGKEVEPATATLALTTAGNRDRVDYQLIPRNVGGAATEAGGTITVIDKLPPGLSTKAAPEGEGWTCKKPGVTEKEEKAEAKHDRELKLPLGAGWTEVACTSSTAVNADANAASIEIEAYVETSVITEPTLTNEATVSGGGAVTVRATDTATVSSTPASFGLQSFSAAAFGENGEKYAQAGGHPYAATASFFFNTAVHTEPPPLCEENDCETSLQEPPTSTLPPGNVKDVDVKLPAGFIGNPGAAPRCSQAEFTQGVLGGSGPNLTCKAESQVGVATLYLNGFGAPGENLGVYNLAPPAGVPAEFGFIFARTPVRFDARVVREPDHSGQPGEYRVTVLSADINELKAILGVTLTLWGVPQSESHAPERFAGLHVPPVGGEKDDEPEKPFLTNPTDCLAEAKATGLAATEPSDAPITTIAVDRWQTPGGLDAQGDPELSDPNWLQSTAESPLVTGCNLLRFKPSISFGPGGMAAGEGTSQADEPSGYRFELEVPQNEAPAGLATPELKSTTVTLPEGVSISPSAGNGLAACSESQIDLQSIGQGSCPLASQVGEVTIHTPLLLAPLKGRVYIGEPLCSPCSPQDAEDGRLFRLLIEAEGSGVRVKLPGTASVNTSTGQLTTTFPSNPQLPFETLILTLKEGPRSPLANPQACGSYQTAADLTPWSMGGTAEGVQILGTPDATPQSNAFNISWDGHGGGCPGTLRFNPAFKAGTESSTAGAYSNFDVTFERQDREQDLSGITVHTPPGLLGKIAGVSRCAEEQANAGTCPEASKIGTATSAAGAGTEPYVVSGPVYLTNGYKGAPFGLSIVVPANAGPFHLGNVIVRAAISVDHVTSALTITSDPLPQKIDGVPFRLKVVKVDVERNEFMFNPTSCEGKAIAATLTGAPVKGGEGSVTSEKTAPFTASSCAALPFKPTLTATTEAKTSKADGASLDVSITQAPKEANIHKVELQLPLALPSRLTTLQKACTEAQFAANPAGCPEASNVGTATALTPLLNVPLEGPAYLVSHGGAAFPDLVFLLQGEGVQIELTGHTDIKKEITYSRFETVPDAPISSFETKLPEGPHSILAANANLCTANLTAPTKITAQNNAQISQETKIAVLGCPPTVAITSARVKGSRLLVTVKTSATGTIKIAGAGLKTTVKRGVKAGSHLISVPLSKAGKAAARHHKKIKVAASLTAAKQAVTTTASVKG
ncbi:MAG: hypothetical protein ABSG95_02245 [Solirubrobacteraceae bacterium]